MRETVAKFAQEHMAHRVLEQDAKGYLDRELLEALFENGLMGIEAPPELGGVGLGFTASCLAVEEIAKVDPAVAVLMDIQNTLLVTAFREYGTQAQREAYLPRLA